MYKYTYVYVHMSLSLSLYIFYPNFMRKIWTNRGEYLLY